MNIGSRILSELTIFSKYAKYLTEEKRRESWEEICARYQEMMIKKYPALTTEICANMVYVYQKKILPSMRALQFAGPAIDKAPSRIFNCGYLPIDSLHSFSEIMFLLLGGTGVGYSVQFHHVDKLPEINKSTKHRRFLINDSIEGWSDAVKVLINSYFGKGSKPNFDFNDIRPKGSRLVTAGGKAPGPEPLKVCLFHIETILERKVNGDKLIPIEVHDIICHIANAVLAGGIRRAALIALFSFDDQEMLSCKFGNWWELNEQRGRANNSAVIKRDRIKKEEFKVFWDKIKSSNSGEPGMYFTNNIEWGCNPCCEIALRPFQFCNLTEVNVSDVKNQADYEERVKAASFFGTLQAGFTDFHYLRDIWKRNTEKDALIGVGMTGIASGEVMYLDMQSAAKEAVIENKRVSKLIGINTAARTTTVKPSGTTSCVLGSSSGIHAWHDNYYLRTMRFNKNEAIVTYLSLYHPYLLEPDVLRPQDTVCVRIPIKAPGNAILRSESALHLLERVKKVSYEWVKSGHINGDNSHNVSVTVSIRDHEWEDIGNWMWYNKEVYNGISVLPFDGHTYKQAPFESISKEEYEKKVKELSEIDFSKVVEMDDFTDLKGEVACGAEGCEIK